MHLMYLESDKLYGCVKCKVHLNENNEIISKAFRGRHGKAYLFNNVYLLHIKQKKYYFGTIGG